MNLTSGARVTVRQPLPPRWTVAAPTSPRVAVLPVRGPAGPQGQPGADGGGTGWRLLVGDRVPFDRNTDPPTDGDWTWSNESRSWFGPAYEVSWQVGDNVGVVPYVEGLGSGAVQPSTLVGAGPYASDQPAEGIPQYDWNINNPDGYVTTATVAGSGIIFIIQQEEGYGGPTAPARPDLDVLDYLGDLVLTNGTTVVPWAPDEGDGDDGDYYLHRTEKTLYGPRATNGSWGANTPIVLNNPNRPIDISADQDVPLLNGYAYSGGVSDLVVLINGVNQTTFRVEQDGTVHADGGVVMKSPNGTAYRLVVADDGTLSAEVA